MCQDADAVLVYLLQYDAHAVVENQAVIISAVLKAAFRYFLQFARLVIGSSALPVLEVKNESTQKMSTLKIHSFGLDSTLLLKVKLKVVSSVT